MTLYHYTSAAGLQGILQGKSLWATDHRFLNDTSEFTHGWKIVFDTLKRRRAELDEEVWNTIEGFRLYNQREGVFAFVASLTSEGDLLSQWRGYGGGRGFVIGFNSDWLHQNATEQDFDIHPVVYAPDKQLSAAEDAVTLLLKLSSQRKPGANVRDIVQQWWMHALKVALVLKDQNFREESEHRLLWIGLGWPPGLKTRVAPSGIIPYRSCHFDKKKVNITLHPSNFGIEEIIVGPALGRQQLAAVDALLASCGMRTGVRKSEIPFITD